MVSVNDKDMHVIAGAVVYALAMTVMDKPLIAVVVIAAAKEGYDYFSGKGCVEFADFAMTCLGGLIIAGLR